MDDVLAVATEHHVITGTPVDDVPPVPAVHEVVAGPGADDVVAVAALDAVVTRTTQDEVGSRGAAQHGLGLLHLLATLDPDGLDVVLDAWSSLDCTAEGLEVERLDTGDVPGDRVVGATVRTGDAFDLQLVQTVVVAQQGAAVSVVVVTGPSDQVAAVALEASTTALS